MKYDFTSVLDRRGTNAFALDALGQKPGFAPDAPEEGFDAIPMWVADMNFPTVPTVCQRLIRRAEHPAFGYFLTPDSYAEAIIRWQETRNGVTGLRPEHIAYENGVLGGVVSALQAICSPGDEVLVHSPTYIGFEHAVTDSGYRLVHSPLRADDAGVLRMDLADMEEKIVEHNLHAAILCSPHNPTGRVWAREELEACMALFEKHHVYVISDEIWSDLTRPGVRHIPTQSVSEDARRRTVALYAPSKTFNLAGLIGSYHIVYDPWLRARMEKTGALSHYNSMNVMSLEALLGAYTPEGHEWLDELREVLFGNIDRALEFFAENAPEIRIPRPEGTYMLFLDCTEWCRTHGKTLDELLKAGWRVGVAWQDGRPFGGECHIRMNLALPRSRVDEALSRLEKHVFGK